MLHSKPSERVWFRRNDRARFVASESGRFLVMFDSLSFSLVLGPPLADARPSRREGEITRGNLCRHQCPLGEVGPSGPGEGNAVCQQVHCDARKDPLPPLRRRPPPLRGRGDVARTKRSCCCLCAGYPSSNGKSAQHWSKASNKNTVQRFFA